MTFYIVISDEGQEGFNTFPNILRAAAVALKEADSYERLLSHFAQ